MLELKLRVPFGPANRPADCTPWPGAVPNFSLQWLEKSFVPDQEARLRQVTDAIAAGTKQIEKVRAEAAGATVKVGQRLPNGNLLRTSAEQRLQADIETHAKQQVVARIIEIRQGLDNTVPPIIKVMNRASAAAQTLSERVFDKLSCLSRFSAGLGKLELATLKANYATFLRGMAPIELFRLTQNAIDSSDPQALILLDAIRVENFGRPKDQRAFENAKLLGLVTVAESDQAAPLLQRVVDLFNQGYTSWLDFSGQTMRATNLRMGHAMGQTTVPIDGE